MKYKNHKKPNLIVMAITTLFLFIVLNTSFVAFAYFSSQVYSQSKSTLDVRLIFGYLDASLGPTGPWGSETNPYLISEDQHLRNLYTLQNRTDRTIINDNSVFQVSDKFGKPNYIGSTNSANLEEIPSIGTERFPFTSKLRGVRTTNPAEFVTLPSGEKSDTSVFGNIRVQATSNQIDIGLFGNVGPTTAPAPGVVVGELSTLLLYNIQISTNALGTYESGHSYFVSTGTYETNHIGILVGHAQYTSIKNISVYYSGPMESQKQKDVKAFDINADTLAKYTTASGIVGHYNNIVVNDETTLPVSSTGFPDQIGGGNTGLGLGVVYSEDIWTFMEENTFNGVPATQNEYNIQETFGAELYGSGNTTEKYFHIGVFTFAHSKQTRAKDKLSKLWSEPNSNLWNISTTGNYSTTTVKQSDAKKYVTTRITNTLMDGFTTGSGTSQYSYHQLKSQYRDYNNYRYMITVMSGTDEYALIRYGDSAIPKKIDPTNFIIPEADLNYYTFSPLTTRSANIAYPPYSSGSSYAYATPNYTRFMTRNVNYAQYAAYGSMKYSGTTIIEAPRPLRVFYLGTNTPSTSFNASSSTSIEGLHFHPNTGVAYDAAQGATGSLTANPATGPAYNTFSLERTNGTGGTPQNYYMTFDPATGFSAAPNLSAAVAVRMYAVRITANTGTPSESPTNADYNKIIRGVASNSKTYDMRYNTLKYTGNENSSVPAQRYKYDIQTIESLNWSDNEGKALTKVDTTLKMGDPTSYYYISGADNPYWGVTTGIPSPAGMSGTINVPSGSIGFTVNGTGKSGTTSKVYVIVSTDPKQDVNQTITISRFGSGNSQTGDRTTIKSFVLPPIPQRLTADTYPIYINDNGTNYVGYTNLNTMLVAYEFSVDSRYTITYFLEASMGSGSFVYLSSERTAATDNNPTHENDVFFPYLSGVEFVFRGPLDQTRIATVGSPEYVSSLTALYFGMKANPANPTGANPAVDAIVIPIINGFNFNYSIGRVYNDTEKKYYLYVTITIPSYQTTITKTQLIAIMNNMNFNYSEWSYLDSANYNYLFSDVVVMTINNYTITNWAQDLTP